MWTDKHISKEMLAAHLDPNTDAASRMPAVIDATVSWIDSWLGQDGNRESLKILDLGCGPGLYTSRLARLGYSVTGVDFSGRSIRYAAEKAEHENLDLSYRCQDYLTLDETEAYDLVTLIYCDIGVFPATDRDRLLGRIHQALKPGGRLLFDVFQPCRYKDVKEERSWYEADSGFWRPGPHLVLTANWWYSEWRLHLNQYIVLDETGQPEIYRLWDKAYTSEEMTEALRTTGFCVDALFSDTSGAPYREDSEILCVLARKP